MTQCEQTTTDEKDDIDINELLTNRRQVAVIWSTEDVQGVRPDLSDDQAWEVLKECRDKHDCEFGFTWLLIETVANEIFPSPDDPDDE